MNVIRLNLKFAMLLFFLISCDKPRSQETVFPKPTEECKPSTIKDQYLVRWSNGQITKEGGSSRDSFIQTFLLPNMNRIDFVENDQRIHLDNTLDNLASPLGENSDYPDNWGIERIGAAQSWAAGIRGQGITVAVIDSGVDVEHPSLKNQIYANPGESGLDHLGRDKSNNGVDDDDNGLIDDVNGYDFAFDSEILTDHSFHGTHVAGIIAAEHGDVAYQKGHVQGVAPSARILPLAFIDSSGGGSLSDAIRAIDYAVLMGAKIINASWGGAPCSKILGAKISSLSELNVLFLSAAGNRGVNIDEQPEYPASYNLPSQITVGAVGPLNLMADFSNYGDRNVHLFAPGLRIVSTVPGGGSRSATGTSMATPFASGVAALLWSSRPKATANEIRAALLESVDKDSSYRNSSQGRLFLKQK